MLEYAQVRNFNFDKDELPDFNKTYDEKRLNNLYNVLENHTYKSRWKQILDTIGMEYVDDLNDITVTYKIDNLNKLDEFIKKAILHYQYLNKRVCICQGENKFSLGIEENIENKIINKLNLNHDGQFDVYYI